MSDKYLMDGHKLLWHADRVATWQKGERIAPIHIDAGLSKGCNIRCEYCFGALQRNIFTKGKNIYFPREPLLNYMRDAGRAGVRSVAFIGESEPLLNPHVYEAIAAGRQAGMDMALGTNGLLLDTGKAGQEALELLSWFRFNISAATPESYHRVHSSKDFATAIHNIKFCVAEKRRRGLSLAIGLQMVLIPSNVDQVVPLAKLGRELGVDYFVVKHCSDNQESDLGIFEKLGDYASFESMLKDAEAQSHDDYNVVVKWQKITNLGQRNYDRCLGYPFLLASSGDGRVYPCGMFFDKDEEDFRIGDLTQQSFIEILESDRYQEVLERVTALDVHTQCYSNCRAHMINEYVWKIKNPPPHVNFV